MDYIENKLDSDENIEKKVKVIDITNNNSVTDSSTAEANLEEPIEHGIFKKIYFTNKRVFLVDVNVADQYISDTEYKFEDILDIRFTNKRIKVEHNEDGEYFIKERMQTSKIIGIILACIFIAFILILYFHNARSTAVIFIIGIVCSVAAFAMTTIREDTIDEIVIEVKGGKVHKILIASDDYEEVKEYMQNRLIL